MKTIFVVYSNQLDADIEKYHNMKRYVFRTKKSVKIGDVLKSQNYDTKMIVVEILEKDFLYYNKQTGELSNEVSATTQFPIREIKITNKEPQNIVTAISLGNINNIQE